MSLLARCTDSVLVPPFIGEICSEDEACGGTLMHSYLQLKGDVDRMEERPVIEEAGCIRVDALLPPQQSKVALVRDPCSPFSLTLERFC